MEDPSPCITRILADGEEPIQVTLCTPPAVPSCTALFAVGRGGNPQRHLPLLCQLAAQGCTVIAPHFKLLVSSIPTGDELRARARGFELALESFAPPGVPLVGIGHSIGATMLLTLAGGKARTLAGETVSPRASMNFDGLALFAPATDFFRAPHALDVVHTRILAWVGTNDSITPSGQAEFLKDVLGSRMPVDIRRIEGAGHFTFMHELPPQIEDSYPTREALLAEIGDQVCQFSVTAATRNASESFSP